MKDISETHPSLNGLVAHIAGFGNNDREDAYFVSDIQAHTIDKAVLKERLPKIIELYMNKLHSFRADESSIQQGWERAVNEIIYDLKSENSFILKEIKELEEK